MTTPEGKVKAQVKQILSEYLVYSFMPVQHGYGSAGVDFHCVLPGGLAFFIETKEEGKEPSDRQVEFLRHKQNMGIQVFVIDGDSGYIKLKEWLKVNYLISLQIPMVGVKV